MNRPGHEDLAFFLGDEVERTPAYGMKTLFVIGLQSVDQVRSSVPQDVRHIFFGANHSFSPTTSQEWRDWERLIMHFLELGYLCTLDIPVKVAEEFHETGLCEYDNFIPQIRIAVPYIKLWNYNTMIKIDDRDFNSTNPGVWCHSLHDLMSRDQFTAWHQYLKDTPL